MTGYYGLLKRTIEFFQTGKAPASPEETLETLAFMEAADLSKARNGAAVKLSEVLSLMLECRNAGMSRAGTDLRCSRHSRHPGIRHY